MDKKHLLPTAVVLALVAGQVGTAQAAITTYTNLTAWETAVGGSYTETRQPIDNGISNSSPPPNEFSVSALLLKRGTLMADMFPAPIPMGLAPTWWTNWSPTCNQTVGCAPSPIKVYNVTTTAPFGSASNLAEVRVANTQHGLGFFLEASATSAMTLAAGFFNSSGPHTTIHTGDVYGVPVFFGYTGTGVTGVGVLGIPEVSGGFQSFGWGDFFEPNVAVPEPASLALLGSGIIGLGFARRRRKAKAKAK